MAGRSGALQMWVADMELPCFPEMQSAIESRAQHATFGYTIQPGVVWEGVRQWLAVRQGYGAAEVPPAAAFVFSASVVTSFSCVLRGLTREGDGVLVMTPLYAPLQRTVIGTGRRLVDLRLGDVGSSVKFGLGDGFPGSINALTSQLAARLDEDGGVRVMLLCSPHNPSGRVWRRHELVAIAEVCAARKVLVVADEIWADWVLDKDLVPFTPFAPVAAAAGCAHIILGAPTKTFSLAGLHASYLIVPDSDLRKQYLAYVEPAFLTFGSIFATVALSTCYVDSPSAAARWLEGARAHVAGNVRRLRELLEQHACGRVVALPLEATHLVWLDCSSALKALRIEPAELTTRLLDAGLVLSPGSEFEGPSGGAAHFQRINVACPRKMVEEAARRLCQVVAFPK
ncbi:hypothetical protein CYMTET_6080 [Cymbomonas tetramitiformis]|uniref:cysteine-S-conjugate beta-lyase n=1 Tax=Cymbomonas tetramitiformis TaxID=36881 RepID=A0AAE0GY68_9CHLO|nr:hypothetical protein CYMTET_6080 [Cymbomonas tetramitiformis]